MMRISAIPWPWGRLATHSLCGPGSAVHWLGGNRPCADERPDAGDDRSAATSLALILRTARAAPPIPGIPGLRRLMGWALWCQNASGSTCPLCSLQRLTVVAESGSSSSVAGLHTRAAPARRCMPGSRSFIGAFGIVTAMRHV